MGWNNARTLAPKAMSHTAEMKRKYGAQIQECIDNSKVYTGCITPWSESTPEFIVDDNDSVTSIFNQSQYSDRIAVLNFASFNSPGGGFIRGAMAQEEALCHASFLYNVLKAHESYYEKNITMRNRGLYKNRAIYTPNVMFFRNEDSVVADVITCAAPNKSLLYKYNKFTEMENLDALYSRIDFISNIVNEHKPEIVILGAFGCGVFKQNPVEVADIFHKVFRNSAAKTVVFSIPDSKNRLPFKCEFA